MKTTPFKLRSGNKPSIAKLSGRSAVKKVSQKVTEGFSKNKHNYGKTTKVTTTTKDGSTSFIEKSNKTGRTVSSGGGTGVRKASTPKMNLAPKFDPMKTMKPGVVGFEDFQKTIKKTATDIVSKKPASYASKVFRGFKNLAKGIGGRATGVAGMMMGTIGTADANPSSKTGKYDPKTNTYK
tara:strand:- start:50 stop:592 length:543 start_codon:yes stop_codon:yes gene_type:complete